MSIPIRIVSEGTSGRYTWVERIDTGARWMNVTDIKWSAGVDRNCELTLTLIGRIPRIPDDGGLNFVIEERELSND